LYLVVSNVGCTFCVVDYLEERGDSESGGGGGMPSLFVCIVNNKQRRSERERERERERDDCYDLLRPSGGVVGVGGGGALSVGRGD
jgi:hypothetical protein